ncbi:MAG: glycosyltransferase, partial [Bryobacteraceae bacterium]
PQARDEDLARCLGLAGRFNIMFAGTMGTVQALDSVLDAAKLCAASNLRIQFVFVGGGVERPRLEEKAARAPNVLFLPAQPMHAMSPLLALADVLLVHLKDDPLFRITIPSKTQAFLAAAKPLLMAASGDASDIVKQAQAGVLVQPENPRAIADAALELARLDPDRLREMGASGRSFYLREMSMETGIQSFERVFQTVVSPAAKRGVTANRRTQNTP